VIRTLRPAALVVVVGLSFACATAPRVTPSRDRFPLDPREGLIGSFPASVEDGWRALSSGDARRARAEFEASIRAEPSEAARIGRIEALVAEGSLAEALEACPAALEHAEPTAPLLTACGEAQARSGKPREAWELYRRAAAKAPNRPGIESRTAELRSQARDQMRREAQEAAGAKDWTAARRAAAQAIELDPASASARETAGDVERDAGNPTAALRAYQEALERNPADDAVQRKLAAVAVELSDWTAAVPVLDKLAARDPKFVGPAEEARLAFRVANWPDAEREAARSKRISRGEAALLTWWMVPEVREASVSSGVIASDVVGRPDAPEVTRAVSLGLIDVDTEMHRARPDAPLSLAAAARLYLRLVVLIRKGAPACFGAAGGPIETLSQADAIRVARACALLEDDSPASLSGAAFTRAIDRVRALASGRDVPPGRSGNAEKRP